MLKEFMENYVEDVEKVESNEKTDKLLFLRDTFSEILECFSKSKDKDLNWGLFCDRGEKINLFKKEYHALKSELVLLKYFSKKRKLPQNF